MSLARAYAHPLQILLGALLVLVAFAIGFGAPRPAQAQSVGAFVSPGELASAHADLSGLSGCLQCHSVGAGVSADKCMSCHEEVAAQVQKRTGFHADKGKACETCHADHRGADAPLIRLDMVKFDHGPTGFPLDGAHGGVSCEECHTKPGVWTGLESDCASCHKDPHGSSKGRPNLGDCKSCHDTAAWEALPLSSTVFDHTDVAQVDYTLHGQHTKVACEDCHKDWKFVPVPSEACTDCHADPHNKQFGTRTCDDCHTVEQDAFALRGFDHARTDFPLVGPHRKASCEDCHGDGRKARYVDLPHDRCETCHSDPHEGQFKPRDCDACHLPTAPSFALAGFDHSATSFPLVGEHEQVSCEACHGEGSKAVFAGLPAQGCHSCHEDPHDTRFAPSTCASCHADGTWDVASFDHARTSFALTGAHVDTPCTACHGEGDTHQLKGLTFGSCADCHADEDPHRSPAAATCTDCHETADWAIVGFAHSMATDFPLTGQHADAACEDCHADPTFAVAEATCEGCHTKDRPAQHFEGACGTCHLPEGWRPATLGADAHAGTGFALYGAHATVACADCHDSAPTASPFCVDCHASDDPHRNQLGNACNDCHTPTTWFVTRFQHATTGWPLRGAHQIATCSDCHATGYVGTPTTCRRCHEEDRPSGALHRDPLAADCETCHRPYAWEPARFPHGELE